MQRLTQQREDLVRVQPQADQVQSKLHTQPTSGPPTQQFPHNFHSFNSSLNMMALQKRNNHTQKAILNCYAMRNSTPQHLPVPTHPGLQLTSRFQDTAPEGWLRLNPHMDSKRKFHPLIQPFSSKPMASRPKPTGLGPIST